MARIIIIQITPNKPRLNKHQLHLAVNFTGKVIIQAYLEFWTLLLFMDIQTHQQILLKGIHMSWDSKSTYKNQLI